MAVLRSGRNDEYCNSKSGIWNLDPGNEDVGSDLEPKCLGEATKGNDLLRILPDSWRSYVR
jgi:hypothetical protein